MTVDPTQREFGKVDMITARVLAPLMDGARSSGLQWMAWTEPRRKMPGEPGPGGAWGALITITLQLYCPRKNAQAIGKYLSEHKMQLADPVLGTLEDRLVGLTQVPELILDF